MVSKKQSLTSIYLSTEKKNTHLMMYFGGGSAMQSIISLQTMLCNSPLIPQSTVTRRVRTKEKLDDRIVCDVEMIYYSICENIQGKFL